MKIKQYRLFMQGRRVHLATLFSFCLFASCSDDNLPLEKIETDTPIGFSSTISPQEKIQTRAGVVTDISNMYVFASYTATADWQTTDIPNFMYKQLMEKSGSNWTYTPLKYWPNSTNDKISFFAYAPANFTDLTTSENSTAGPALTYIVPANESAQQDLLAGSCLNRTKTTGTVSFSMKHALTQVKFKIQSGDTKSSKVLKALSIDMPATGTLSFGSTADGEVAWTTTGEAKTFMADANLNATTTITLTDANKDNIVATFFLLPVGDPSSKVTLTLTYTVQKSSISETPVTVTVPLSISSPQWKPGSNLIYSVSVLDNRLEIQDVTISDFENCTVTEGDISAT